MSEPETTFMPRPPPRAALDPSPRDSEQQEPSDGPPATHHFDALIPDPERSALFKHPKGRVGMR